jgi:hypothetical protein
VSLREMMVRGADGRFEQTAGLTRGGGASILIVFASWVLDALSAPVEEAGRAFVLIDATAFLAVGSRRLFTWLAVQTAPPVDVAAKLPERVPRPPANTLYKRIDLNHVSVRDFGRHGRDLDQDARTFARICAASTGSRRSTGGSIRRGWCGRAACCSCGCACGRRGSCRTAAGFLVAWPPGSGG